MKLTNIVKQILKEKAGDVYEYGCAMLYFDFPEINKVHDAIDPKELYEEEDDRSYGIENEPHTTLLYGLHKEVDTNEIKKVLDSFTFGECTISNASLFENEKYDVLKFDVAGPNLHEANRLLTEFPHTTTYPDYHPHLTIAYLKPGCGQRYVNILKGQQYQLVPKRAVYSKPDGTKVKIKIKVK
jgi:hypothetical protein